MQSLPLLEDYSGQIDLRCPSCASDWVRRLCVTHLQVHAHVQRRSTKVEVTHRTSNHGYQFSHKDASSPLTRHYLLAQPTHLKSMMRLAMLLNFILAAFFSILAAAAPTALLGTDLTCGFTNRGGSSPEYTFLNVTQCHTLGKAAPVRNLYRDPACDCTFYEYVLPCGGQSWTLTSNRDAECKKATWYLSVDYATLHDDVSVTSAYYKCTTRSGRGSELKKS